MIIFCEKSDYIISSIRLESITVRAIHRVDGVEAAGSLYTSITEIVSTEKPLKVSLLAAEAAGPGYPTRFSGC